LVAGENGYLADPNVGGITLVPSAGQVLVGTGDSDDLLHIVSNTKDRIAAMYGDDWGHAVIEDCNTAASPAAASNGAAVYGDAIVESFHCEVLSNGTANWGNDATNEFEMKLSYVYRSNSGFKESGDVASGLVLNGTMVAFNGATINPTLSSVSELEGEALNEDIGMVYFLASLGALDFDNAGAVTDPTLKVKCVAVVREVGHCTDSYSTRCSPAGTDQCAGLGVCELIAGQALSWEIYWEDLFDYSNGATDVGGTIDHCLDPIYGYGTRLN